MAVARYPFMFLNDTLAQPVYKAFFDDGKFWSRPWRM
jgi:hypothetical protein